jgi:hypothetical protein
VEGIFALPEADSLAAAAGPAPAFAADGAACPPDSLRLSGSSSGAVVAAEAGEAVARDDALSCEPLPSYNCAGAGGVW